MSVTDVGNGLSTSELEKVSDDLRLRLKSARRENKRLMHENRTLSAECDDLKQNLFADTTIITKLDQEVQKLKETLVDERRLRDLEKNEAIGVALAEQKRIMDAEKEMMQRAHEKELCMFEQHQRESRARYEEELSCVNRRLANLTSDGSRFLKANSSSDECQTQLVRSTGQSAASCFPTAIGNDTVQGDRQQQKCLAHLSKRLESSERELATAKRDRAYTREKLRAALSLCKLDTMKGLRELWRALGGAAGWRSVISEEAFSSMLRDSNVTVAFVAATGTAGWEGQPTVFLSQEELGDFVSVVLARLPSLTTLCVDAASRWPFQWHQIQQLAHPFPSLRQIVLSRVRWTEDAVLTACENIENFHNGDYLDDFVLDETMGPAHVNFTHLRRNCHAVLHFFKAPITTSLKDCLPKLVWQQILPLNEVVSAAAPPFCLSQRNAAGDPQADADESAY